MRTPAVSISTLAAVCSLTVAPLLAQQPAPAAVTGISADKAAKDGSVWGALVYASNAPETKQQEKAPEFPDLQKRLAKAFPYKNFEVLGQHNQVVFREYESWVVPSRDVFLKLDSKGTNTTGGLNLHVQFWQGQQVLVKTDTMLLPDSPLFIGGPKWRDGQIIFVLLLKKMDTTAGK